MPGGKTRQDGETMNIQEEMLKLAKLKHIGLALVDFVYSLENGVFVQKQTDWVYTPNHFVAFGFPKKPPEQIRLQFRQFIPNLREEKDVQLLPLFAGRHNHCKCLITTPRQLACAAKYIELAFRYPC